MIGFREFREHQSVQNESIARKGTVALYASQSKRYGDESVKHFNRARQRLNDGLTKKSAEQKVDALSRAFQDLLDGLISQRHQIGSVSAQVTAHSSL